MNLPLIITFIASDFYNGSLYKILYSWDNFRLILRSQDSKELICKNITQLLSQKQFKLDEIEVKMQCDENTIKPLKIKLKLSYIS